METTVDQNNTQIMNFWYDFDKFFLSREMSKVMRPLNPYRKLFNSFLHHYEKKNIETDFKSEYEDIKDSVKLLADNHARIIDEHFGGNMELEQMAFELFAQGLLFDDMLDEAGNPRRPEGDKIHMMDSSITGYIVWHAFVRLVVLLFSGGDDDDGSGTIDSNKWLQTDRHLGLAAGILAELKKSGREPIQSDDATQNKPLESNKVEELRRHWLNLNFPEIDDGLVRLNLETISEHTGIIEK